MNHLQFVQSEAYISPSERRWETWIAEVRRLSGLSIELNTADESDAHDCWLAGDTPAQCVTELSKRSVVGVSKRSQAEAPLPPGIGDHQ